MNIDSLPFCLYFLALALAASAGLGQKAFPRRRRDGFCFAGLVVSPRPCLSSTNLLPCLNLTFVFAGFGFTHFAMVAAVRPDVTREPI